MADTPTQLDSSAALSFAMQVAALRARVERQLALVLPSAQVYPAALHEAMRYACHGGKRLRALLVYATGCALGVPYARLDAAAVAVELIHAYSLVHDDLPAMDDDALRRGRPTCHVVFGEATAILVGDALQALAFQVLARQPAEGMSADARLAGVAELAQASGSRGMVGGQAMDIAAQGTELALAELEALHVHKTGALIRCCVHLAWTCADSLSPAQRDALDHYGKCIGLAYQIQDDLLDIEGHSEQLGKTAGKDENQLKCTYPQVMGLPAARQRAEDLFASARAALGDLGTAAESLLWLADHMQKRDR